MTHTHSESSSRRLDSQPWWTEADQAEWNLLLKEFVDLAWYHKRCVACERSIGWCVIMLEAWDRLLEWRYARILVSKAEYFRAQEYQARTQRGR